MNIAELVKRIAEAGPLGEVPKDASGIYVIVNRITCRAYIGQTRNFSNRERSHFAALRAGNHRNKGLQAAWNECGESAFIFCPIARVDLDRLREEERRLISELGASYNNDELVCPPGQRGQGRKPLQAGVETVTISLRMTPAQKAKLLALGGGQWVRDRIDRAKRPGSAG